MIADLNNVSFWEIPSIVFYPYPELVNFFANYYDGFWPETLATSTLLLYYAVIIIIVGRFYLAGAGRSKERVR
jgi:hypothetical protein